MFWLKRLVFVLIIVIPAIVYLFYRKSTEAERETEASRFALLTAQVWVAIAKYRNEPEMFLAYRDSILKAKEVTAEEIELYLNRYEKEPENYQRFAGLVKVYVDSLAGLQDSLVVGTLVEETDANLSDN